MRWGKFTRSKKNLEREREQEVMSNESNVPGGNENEPTEKQNTEPQNSTQSSPVEEARNAGGEAKEGETPTNTQNAEPSEPTDTEQERPAQQAPSAATPPRRRGFAAMDRDRVKEIASKGGRAAHAAGTAHQFSSDEARVAGKKGGMAPHVRRGGVRRRPSSNGDQPKAPQNQGHNDGR
jgi:uncharacterized protein